MKISDKLGMLVQLVVTCLIDVIPFSIFLFIWLVAFTLLYKVVGAESYMHSEYSNLNKFFMQTVQIWENSIGDISAPTYDYWTKNLDQKSPA